MASSFCFPPRPPHSVWQSVSHVFAVYPSEPFAEKIGVWALSLFLLIYLTAQHWHDERERELRGLTHLGVVMASFVWGAIFLLPCLLMLVVTLLALIGRVIKEGSTG